VREARLRAAGDATQTSPSASTNTALGAPGPSTPAKRCTDPRPSEVSTASTAAASASDSPADAGTENATSAGDSNAGVGDGAGRSAGGGSPELDGAATALAGGTPGPRPRPKSRPGRSAPKIEPPAMRTTSADAMSSKKTGS
jgi:hypothetical protein